MLVGQVPQDTTPDALIAELQRTMNSGDQLGLVRARAGGSDRWVALVGQPQMPISAFPRELALGSELELGVSDGTTWRLLTPSGSLLEGVSPQKPILGEAGEWWLELSRGTRTVMSVPLYVDMPTPPATILSLPGDPSPRPAEAVALGYELIQTIRETFDLTLMQPDSTLETLAQYPLQQALAGDWNRTEGLARLRGAGFVGGPIGQVHCEARTVALCIDDLLWQFDDRRALLDPGLRVIGADAQVTTSGISMVFNMASE